MTWLADPRRDRIVTNPRPVHDTDPPWKEGYRLGEQARAELAPGRGPLQSVQATLEGLGVHVAFVPFATPGVEAAAVREPLALGLILLNSSHERVVRVPSRRSVLAHELCHLLFDATDRHLVTSVTRDTDQGVATEQRANAFAPAFLAPRAELDTSVEPITLARTLVQRWAFSREGAAWYTRSLLGLPQEDGPILKDRLGGTPEAPVEEPVRGASAAGVSSLVHGLVGELARSAYDAGHISEARLREIRELG
ncbi:MAG: ImmA/IrrE family metallo-endopeptidase [Myxococcota bacterium]